MYIRNWGEYYNDKTKGELIIDIEALELVERTLWAQIVEEANTGGIALHDMLTQCRMEVEKLIEQLRANEAKAKEEQEATDAQHDAFVELFKQDKLPSEVAKALGVSIQTAYYHLTKANQAGEL